MNLQRIDNRIWMGRTAIGCESVQVIADFSSGEGGFCLMPQPHQKPHPQVIDYLPWIVIGLKQENWRDVMEIMVHETMEFAYSRMKCRYDNTETEALSTASYVFISNHIQFTEICAMASEFLDDMFLPISQLFLAEQAKRKELQAVYEKRRDDTELLGHLRAEVREKAADKKKRARDARDDQRLSERINKISHPSKKK